MDIVVLVFIGVVVLLLREFFPSYFKKKGENLATKEDIEEITKKMEGIKASMGSQLFVHQTRYQNEFNILMDLSEKLIELRDSALRLRPIIDQINPGQTEDERKQERLKQYHTAALEFYKLYETRKPFYPDGIYAGIKKLDYIVWNEVVQYRHSSDRGRDFDAQYWEKAKANAEQISKIADEVIELIRNRIKYWEEFKIEK